MKNLPLLLPLLFFFLSCHQDEEQEHQRPNIIFIMADDHTSEAWGIYGGHLADYVRADNIKQLAREGTVLNNALCTNSICSPSRASIITGQYSNKNGVYTLAYSQQEGLQSGHPNVAKTLKSNGYQTALFGKWHLYNEPVGFDYYKVLYGQGRYWDPHFLKTDSTWSYQEATPILPQPGSKFSSDVIAESSIDWLENRDKDKPFYLMCHFKGTHEPYDYPERYNDLYANEEIPAPPSLYDRGKQTTGRTFPGQNLEKLGGRWIANSPPNRNTSAYPGITDSTGFDTTGLGFKATRDKIYQKLAKDFMRCGAAVDDNIGKVLRYLKENNLEENTIVIYTADQGYFLGQHGFFDKRLIYEESLHMPFVIRYPKEVRAGKRLDDIILNVDFSALFLDYAGVEKPDYMQGFSFRENLKGNTPEDWRKASYYRYYVDNQIWRPAHIGLRNEKYTLAFFYGLGAPPMWEFYDLQNDPTEIRNAYGDPQYTSIIEEMKGSILAQRVAVGDTIGNSYNRALDFAMERYWD